MEIIFAGFGGQGVLTSGLITAYLALHSGYETIWSPAYGGQMRGGKAYSMVKYDREAISEPIVTELDALVAMNGPSLDFRTQLKEGGLLLVNSSMAEPTKEDEARFHVLRLPVTELAQQVGNVKCANVVAVGALVRAVGGFEKELAEQTLCRFFEEKGKGKLNDMNIAAFRAGYDAVTAP